MGQFDRRRDRKTLVKTHLSLLTDIVQTQRERDAGCNPNGSFVLSEKFIRSVCYSVLFKIESFLRRGDERNVFMFGREVVMGISSVDGGQVQCTVSSSLQFHQGQKESVNEDGATRKIYYRNALSSEHVVAYARELVVTILNRADAILNQIRKSIDRQGRATVREMVLLFVFSKREFMPHLEHFLGDDDTKDIPSLKLKRRMFQHSVAKERDSGTRNFGNVRCPSWGVKEQGFCAETFLSPYTRSIAQLAESTLWDSHFVGGIAEVVQGSEAEAKRALENAHVVGIFDLIPEAVAAFLRGIFLSDEYFYVSDVGQAEFTYHPESREFAWSIDVDSSPPYGFLRCMKGSTQGRLTEFGNGMTEFLAELYVLLIVERVAKGERANQEGESGTVPK
jgi:hypothetical protein